MPSYNQAVVTSQFYLYGKKYCTQSGWRISSSKYKPHDLLPPGSSLHERVYIISGANSGIGYEVANFLVMNKATVYMLCRNASEGVQTQEFLRNVHDNMNVYFLHCDCSLQSSIRNAWNEFVSHRLLNNFPLRLDGLLCNAGSLLNSRSLTREGYEETMATHMLFGTYLLTSLAVPLLRTSPGSRVVVVSSAGMYNTKFPSWSVAMNGQEGVYDGQFAYAYAKRGQVLLCEQWAQIHREIKFVSCHPGWVDTKGMESAFGRHKDYFQPLRAAWEGAEGILWLLLAEESLLQSGSFYLDRQPRVKHLAGPFFTEGSFTKNTPDEVREIMANLACCCRRSSYCPGVDYECARESQFSRVVDDKEVKSRPLQGLQRKVDLSSLTGRWTVQASIPSVSDGVHANYDMEYAYNVERNLLRVSCRIVTGGGMSRGGNEEDVETPGGERPAGTVLELMQQARVSNCFGTEWTVDENRFSYWPMPRHFLLLDVSAEVPSESETRKTELTNTGGGVEVESVVVNCGSADSGDCEAERAGVKVYSSCLIGVPDGSALWILTRIHHPISEELLNVYISRAQTIGYADAHLRVKRMPLHIFDRDEGDSMSA